MPRPVFLLALFTLPTMAGFAQPASFDSWAETHD